MEKARRRHVPAFGEWNYYSPSPSPSASPPDEHEPPQESWWWHAPEPEACSDAWFRYSPLPRRRPEPAPKNKKARRPPVTADGGVVVAVAAEHKRPVQVAAVAVRAPGKGARRVVVVRPVDEDLYRVPPPLEDDDTAVCRLPRRRKTRAARRSLWMGCFGVNCVA